MKIGVKVGSLRKGFGISGCGIRGTKYGVRGAGYGNNFLTVVVFHFFCLLLILQKTEQHTNSMLFLSLFKLYWIIYLLKAIVQRIEKYRNR